MSQDKVRVYALARELNMESKDLLDLCRDNNIDVRNQLSNLKPADADRIVKLVRSGGGVATASPPPRTEPAPISEQPVAPSRPLRDLNTPKKPKKSSQEDASEEESVVGETLEAESAREPVAEKTAEAPAAQADEEEKQPIVAKQASEPAPVAAQTKEDEKPAQSPIAEKKVEKEMPVAEKKPAESEVKKPVVEKPSAGQEKSAPEKKPTEPDATKPESPQKPESSPGSGTEKAATPTSKSGTGTPPMDSNRGTVRNLGSGRRDSGSRERRKRPIPRPAMVRAQVAPPPPLKPQAKPKPEGEDKKGQGKPKEGTPVKISDIPPELQSGGNFSIQKLQDHITKEKQPDVAAPIEDDSDVGGDGKRKKPKQVPGRNQRHREREQRSQKRQQRAQKVGVMDRDDDGQRGRRRKDRIRHKMSRSPVTQERKDKVIIQPPMTVRAFSEATGRGFNEIVKVFFMNPDLPAVTINDVLDMEQVEMLTMELGCEEQVEIREPLRLEDQIIQEVEKEDDPAELKPRAPIVTIMGHVDHGKTSLLDQIRKSRVVDTEVGGITQVIRAWRVEVEDKWITFLDTPGHEAFTQMRARGANVTDIAVIVVAADDGVMPQTKEAISHAKAAGVSIVVAINKVDVPNANIPRTEQQLYGLDLLPDSMGGDVPFVYTSAATGDGIDELLEMIALVAELRELQANPNKPAKGLCLEASLSETEGVAATVLVQEGTLRTKDVVVCGAGFGSIRAMFDDLGQQVDEAGPSVPVRIWGLDVVPNADDPFHVVPDVSTAGKIAEKRKQREIEAAQLDRGPISLMDLGKLEIAELKVILKADVKGSLEAIRKELAKFTHDEVRINVLHAAVGGITESDVNLALTSPQDTIIVGFNAVPDDRARALSEERGIEVRQYAIIYELANDIRAALEGKLKPREEVIHLGRAVVRETFRISRVGTIAGCYVTQGRIERSAFVRVIRNGVVVYPPAERTAGLDSLKRFKDDVREVKEGFECGIKILGYDDVKVDDVIEAYRIEQIQRSLDDRN